MKVYDFYIKQDVNGNWDLQLGNNLDFEYVQGFDTAFLYQIFCDKRGTKFDTALPRNRGGWIGDLLTKESGYESGSLIWLKKQSRGTQADLNEVAAAAENALQFFIDIGAAQKVSATVTGNQIKGTITVDQNSTNSFLALWKNLNQPTS